MNFRNCPRCQSRAFERFSMYGICHDCNYFEVKQNRRVPDLKITKRRDDYQAPHPFLGGPQGPQGQFTDDDHRIVRRAMLSIPDREQRVVFYYFWKDLKKTDIAEKLGLTLDQVEKVLQSAYERLKDLCLRNSKFSRAFRQEIVMEAAA